MNLTFGVPSQRVKKEEKYPDTAVVTIKATEKGKAKKFEFNRKASDLLGLGDNTKVSVSYSEDSVMFVNTTSLDNEIEKYNITKGSPRTFSNAKVYNYTIGFLRLSESVDNEFKLVPVDGAMFEGRPIFKLTPMIDSGSEENIIEDNSNETENTAEEVPAEAQEV